MASSAVHLFTLDANSLDAVRSRLTTLLVDHPYLGPPEANVEGDPHPLYYYVRRCNESLDKGDIREATAILEYIDTQLKQDEQQVAAAFRKFDHDKSGFLCSREFKQMCAYLYWDGNPDNLMDVDDDGQVSLEEFHAYVQRHGGLRKLFNKRSERTSRGRRDTSAGVSIGSRVRAHCYEADGSKSASWKEAKVLDVRVKEGCPDAPGDAVMLGFIEAGSVDRCIKQVVPSSFIVSSMYDANVALAMREVGILDEEQALWSSILSESEMRAVERLVSCQRAAIAGCRAEASSRHEEALPSLKRRFSSLGFTTTQMEATLAWIQDLAPVLLHVNLDKCGHFFEVDGYYRNQFETGSSGGHYDKGNRTRIQWEDNLFGGAYANAKPFDRVKYGVLSVTNDYRGVVSCSHYGDSYFVLKDVRLRLTLSSEDSGGLAGRELAVLDKYAHVLKAYRDEELHAVVSVATAAATARSQSHDDKVAPQLLRGSTADATEDWITVGFPNLQQRQGSYYFEVELLAGCRSPQVGLLSSKFNVAPHNKSLALQGVGDDQYGWAVDGVHAARWHNGQPLAWNTLWHEDSGLKQRTVVGVAVNLDSRTMSFSTNGVWPSEGPAFDSDTIPEGVSVYPAVSVKGRAAFIFGPSFLHGPPGEVSRAGILSSSDYAQWPQTPSSPVLVDCPLVGKSGALRNYKEVQIHGELSLKRNVQRLVASEKYRNKSKVSDDAWVLHMTDAGPCQGKYKRIGAHAGMPLYKKASDEDGVIYWSQLLGRWCAGDVLVSDSTWRCGKRLGSQDLEVGELRRVRITGCSGCRVSFHGTNPFDYDCRLCCAARFCGMDLERPFLIEACYADSLEEGEKNGLKGASKKGKRMRAIRLLDQDEDAWHYAALPAGDKIACRPPRVGWERPPKDEDAWHYAALPAGDKIACRPPRVGWERPPKEQGVVATDVFTSTMAALGLSEADIRQLTSALEGGGLIYRKRLHACLDDAWAALEAPPCSAATAWQRVVEEVQRRVLKEAGCAGMVVVESPHPYPAKLHSWSRSIGFEAGQKLNIHFAKQCRTYDKQAKLSIRGLVLSRLTAGMGSRVRLAVPGGGKSVCGTVVKRVESEPWLVRLDPTNSGAGAEQFAMWADTPASIAVSYRGGTSPGEELVGFEFDTSFPLTPLRCTAFSDRKGPAQQAGVKTGWFLDLEATLLELSGRIRPGTPASAVGANGGGGAKAGLGAPPNLSLEMALQDPEATRGWMRSLLASTMGVTLVFTDGSGADVLPEAYVTYPTGVSVESEIASFSADGKAIYLGAFAASHGPAREAGVSPKVWRLDLQRTLGQENPGKRPTFSEAEVLADPSLILRAADVTLVMAFVGNERLIRSNPLFVAIDQKSAQSSLPWSIICRSGEAWTNAVVNANVASFTFETDGDGRSSELWRWGFFALVRPDELEAPSQETVDALCDTWMEATRVASGDSGTPSLQTERWDEARLRALCDRYGWEFEWMSEDGERKRRRLV